MSASIIRSLRVAPMARTQFTRTFIATPYYRKSITDTVADAAKAVDQTVSQGAIKGIEVGETITDKAKAAVGAAPSADEVAGKVKGVAKSTTGATEGTAEEYAGKAKGTYAEAAGTVKGKANEVAGAAEGKKEEVKGQL